MTKSVRFFSSIIARLGLANHSSLFDADYYLEQYPDVAVAGMDAYSHYLNYGIEENRKPNAFFDTQYYLSQVREPITDPTIHYLRTGAKTGLDPHPHFDTAWYLEAYGDVAEAHLNPLQHYLRYGKKEGRRTAPEYKKSFGNIMPSALGYRFEKFRNIELNNGSSGEKSTRYIKELVVPLHVAPTCDTALVAAFSAAAKTNMPLIRIKAAIPVAPCPVTFCIAFSHCRVIEDKASYLRLRYQEAKVFRILEGTPSFLTSASAAFISLSSREHLIQA